MARSAPGREACFDHAVTCSAVGTAAAPMLVAVPQVNAHAQDGPLGKRSFMSSSPFDAHTSCSEVRTTQQNINESSAGGWADIPIDACLMGESLGTTHHSDAAQGATDQPMFIDIHAGPTGDCKHRLTRWSPTRSCMTIRQTGDHYSCPPAVHELPPPPGLFCPKIADSLSVAEAMKSFPRPIAPIVSPSFCEGSTAQCDAVWGSAAKPKGVNLLREHRCTWSDDTCLSEAQLRTLIPVPHDRLRNSCPSAPAAHDLCPLPSLFRKASIEPNAIEQSSPVSRGRVAPVASSTSEGTGSTHPFPSFPAAHNFSPPPGLIRQCIAQPPGADADAEASCGASDPAAAKTASELPAGSTRFVKARMCRFHGMGACTRGDACRFAHFRGELKPLTKVKRTTCGDDQDASTNSGAADAAGQLVCADVRRGRAGHCKDKSVRRTQQKPAKVLPESCHKKDRNKSPPSGHDLLQPRGLPRQRVDNSHQRDWLGPHCAGQPRDALSTRGAPHALGGVTEIVRGAFGQTAPFLAPLGCFQVRIAHA